MFRIDFSTLKDKAEIATGDPIFCKSCQACFNINSKVDSLEDKQVWKCEFCLTSNEV